MNNLTIKKLLSFFAISAVVLMMASCGDGNDPANSKLFDIQITQKTATKIWFTITPIDEQMLYDIWVVVPQYLTDENGKKRTIQEAFEEAWHSYSYADYEEWVGAGTQTRTWSNLIPDTENVIVVYQCDENNNLTILKSMSVRTLSENE